LDAFTGGQIAVAEAARNVACTGATPVAMTNCLNFGNPEKPESFWQLEQAIAGMSQACLELQTPVISGNVSLYNESETGNIFPTPVVGILGLFDSEAPAMTLDFQEAGDLIYLVGDTYNDIGGTEYLKIVHGLVEGMPPAMNLKKEKLLQSSMIESIRKRQVRSAHDLSDGGLSVAIFESMRTRQKGAQIHLTFSEDLRIDSVLFGESQSRVLFSVAKSEQKAFEKTMSGLPCQCIGEVTENGRLHLEINGTSYLDQDLRELTDLYEGSLRSIMEPC
ncbi:MAG: AIR synthase-related protein, partial [Candidatus Margulisiibacteriota bacterium]